MASDYGLNFGFRRSDESVRISEGRFRTPADGPTLLQGTCVEIDPDTPGYLRAGAADVEARPGISGLLVQEEFDRSFYESDFNDSFELGRTKPNRLSVVTNGPGTKVWFKNTDAQNRLDGRDIAAVEIVDFDEDGAGAATTLAVGDRLGWSGTQWVKVDGVTITNAHMEITEVGDAYLEAVLLS